MEAEIKAAKLAADMAMTAALKAPSLSHDPDCRPVSEGAD
jgi:hypothetical protein